MKTLCFPILRVLAWTAIVSLCPKALAAEISVRPPHLLYHAQEMQVTLHAPDHADQRIQFRFEFEDKPLTQGTIGVGPDGFASLTFTAPAPRPGIPLPLTLRLPGNQAQADEQKTTLWIFSEGSVFSEKRRLEEWPLHLYDPTGDTATWLEEHELPFRRVRDLASVNQGILLIGKGISFRRHADLFGRLRELSASGIPVLVLVPAKGNLILAEALQGAKQPDILFARLDKMTGWDPRLKNGGFSSQYFNLTSERGQVSVSMGADEGWSWLNIKDETGAALLLCGVDLTTYAHKSPAPLLLFQTILMHLQETAPNLNPAL